MYLFNLNKLKTQDRITFSNEIMKRFEKAKEWDSKIIKDRDTFHFTRNTPDTDACS